jgi:CheY-like chemotaxis protein
MTTRTSAGRSRWRGDRRLPRRREVALADYGYDVEQAADGRATLDKMRAQAPCIVLLDLMMPIMDGWQVVDAMDEEPMLAGTPVCILSAQAGRAPPQSAWVLQKAMKHEALLDVVSK